MITTAVDISGGGLGQPLSHVMPIIPDDGTDLQFIPRGIYIGGEGNLTLLTIGGTIGVFVGLSAGTILPIRAIRVYATGTTATNLLCLI